MKLIRSLISQYYDKYKIIVPPSKGDGKGKGKNMKKMVAFWLYMGYIKVIIKETERSEVD